MFRYVDGARIPFPSFITPMRGDVVRWYSSEGRLWRGTVVATSIEYQAVWHDGWRGDRLHLIVQVSRELGVYADKVEVHCNGEWFPPYEI